jgi:nitroreductase
MEAIFDRCSIRKYTNKPVNDDIIEKLLRAAMAAPSAGNQQPWEFVVIRDRETLNKIPTFHPYANMLHESPLAILVAGDIEREKHAGYWVQDCSASTQNILLMAHKLGLGAVWLGVYPSEERVDGLKDLFSLPECIIPFSLVSIGYHAEQKEAISKFDTNRIHIDMW